MGVKFANNAYGTLNASITNTDTSLTLSSGQGARFPSLGAGDYFYVTLIDTSNNLEIAKCTARSSDVLTITRGQEGTTARSYSVGDRVELRITAAGISAVYTEAVADATPAADSIVNSMIATGAVNGDSILDNSVTATELAVSGNGTAGQALLSDGDGTMSWGAAGGVLQVVTKSTASQDAFNNTSVNTISSLTTSITPTSSSSKILVMLTITQGGSTDGYFGFNWYRNGTLLAQGNAAGGSRRMSFGFHQDGGHGTYDLYSYTKQLVDSPATTSTLTYTFAVQPMSTTARQFYLNRPENTSDSNRVTGTSHVTLIELAGGVF